MSYDLMVFAPDTAPKKRAPFLAWHEEQTELGEDHSYADPAVATPALQAFYADIVQVFPAMALDEDEEEDEDSTETDYTIGQAFIYMSFPWNRIDDAHATVTRLAGQHGLGFFDVSSDIGETWLPDGKGGLYIAHSD
ncbi:hypothetical protein HF313_08885 [Massilia atriviolacea]|uniref:Uncharacterized protein n=1 Tax=Massilia atriviolacea TaxID=2495579 RepID=A0A430HDG8_9BURK|nr:hypothetical protein [Massilia atriviolacea]RSZ55578.1 hypothetical protein EJB06_28915 [Massilia atriviolacea]